MPGFCACVGVLALFGRVRRAGLPCAFWCASPFPLAALSLCFAWPPLGWGAPALAFFLFSPLPSSARPLCLLLSLVSGPGGPGPWHCVLFVAFRPSVRCRSFCVAPPGCWLLPGGCLPPAPLFFFGFSCRRSVPCAFLFVFFSLPPVSAPVVSRFLWFPAPGAFRPGAVLCVFLPPFGSPCAFAFSFLLLGQWLLLGALPAPPLCLAGFVGAARCPSFFFSSCVRPGRLWLSLVSGPGCPGPWACVLFALWASRFSAVRALSPSFCFLPGRWLLPGGCCPPPPRSVLRSLFFCLVRPRCLQLSLVSGPGCLGPRCCVLFALLASRFSALRGSRLFRASCPAVGCSPVVAAPPPPFVSRGFRRFPSVLCAVCCAVLSVSGCGAALRCCALCIVLLRSFGAAARRAIPSGAPRHPGALCFVSLCFAVSPRAVCDLSLCGGVSCCSPLCFVLCMFWGAVLCVLCPLCSVRCCASLCWCACVVLLVWCVLLLVPGTVVRCCLLCCFLWCAVVLCSVWWPVVVCWCRTVAPCCPLSFAGGVGLCLFPVWCGGAAPVCRGVLLC